MNLEMQRALVDLSTFNHAEPVAVFRRVLEVMAERYPGTMAMVNLIRDGEIAVREVINPHPLLLFKNSIPLSYSY